MDNRSPRSRNILDDTKTTSPMKIHKDSPNIIKNQEPSSRRPRVIIRYIPTAKPIFIDSNDFMATVQRLTGNTSTSSTTSSSSSSPSTSSLKSDQEMLDASLGSSSPMDTTEKGSTLNELGLLGGVKTMDIQNRAMERPNFDHAGPTFVPSISPNLYLPFCATEKANTSNELGFVGGVMSTDQYYHQDRVMERPSSYNAGMLSGPTSMPSISTNYYPPFAATEKANTSSEQGFVGSVRSTDQYHQNRTIQRPNSYHGGILSRPISMPSISPNLYPPLAATEEANTSNEQGFVGGVSSTDQYHHQNQAMERPSLYNSGPTFMPLISPNFYPPVESTIHEMVQEQGDITKTPSSTITELKPDTNREDEAYLPSPMIV